MRLLGRAPSLLVNQSSYSIVVYITIPKLLRNVIDLDKGLDELAGDGVVFDASMGFVLLLLLMMLLLLIGILVAAGWNESGGDSGDSDSDISGDDGSCGGDGVACNNGGYRLYQ